MATCPGSTCTSSTTPPPTTGLSDLPSNPVELSIIIPIIIIAIVGGIAVLALLIWRCRYARDHHHHHHRRQPSQHIVSLDVANPRPHILPTSYTQRPKDEPISLPPAQREKLHIRGNGVDNIEEQPGVVIIME